MNEDLLIKKETFKEFWNLENDKPLVSVKAYKNKAGYHEYIQKIKADKRYREPFNMKINPEININHQLECIKYMRFAGETLPVITTAIGPGICSAFLGAIVDLRSCDEPTWFHEVIDDWDNFNVEFNEWNIWWNIQKYIVECAAKAACENNVFTELPVDIFNGIDTLMLLRGSEKLSLDMLMVPETIKSTSQKIIKYWKYWVDQLFEIQSAKFDGNCVAWLNLWGPERTFCIQSDFMTMISPEMYEEFILDEIKYMCNELDYTMFHFDGPDQVIRHLDFLLDIPNLHGIQWNPETNCENIRHLPTLKKIQDAGKSLILNVAAHEVDELVKNLSPKGLLLNIDPFDEPYPSVKAAEELVQRAKK